MKEIRTATTADIKLCAEAGLRFYQASPYTDVPYCEESMQGLMAEMVDDGMLIILLEHDVVVGGIGGMLAPLFINRKFKVAHEFFWWVDPQVRGRIGLELLKRFEHRAKELNCVYVMMLALKSTDPENKMGTLYERMGYEKSETGYVKRL